MRTHPQSIETVLRVLRKICGAPDSTTAERFRAVELILAAHGRLVLSPDKLPKHNGLRQIQAALELSGTDKRIAGQVRAEQAEERKRQRQKRELTKLLANTGPIGSTATAHVPIFANVGGIYCMATANITGVPNWAGA
jgi:hypothetical protein